MMSLVESKDHDEISVLQLPEGYGNPNTSLAVSLARAEVDQQIATARAMPRSITRAVQNIMTLATLDDVSAEECIYALPRAGKAIKGPSVRLAEIIASQWGNARVGARVVHVDRIEKYVEAEGVFHDLESNTATTARVRRRLSDKRGKLLNEDMIVVTGNAACAIAKRNAILGAVPKAVWRKAYDAVEQVIAGDIKTLGERRERAMKAFAAFGAKPEQVFAALGVGGLDDIGLDHISTLTGMHAALKNGEATVEELFAPPSSDKPPAGLSAKFDALAGSRGHTEIPPHDPETGEIAAGDLQQDAAAPQAATETAAASPAIEAAEDARHTPASPQEADDDGFPGDRPSTSKIDPLAVAYGRGKEAKIKGMARKAVPGEYRAPERKAELDAWLEGFESGEEPA